MTRRSPAARKTLLHCAVCGHDSPPDGDWLERVTTTDAGERLALVCPDCGATLTRRPVGEARIEAVVAD